MRLKTPWRTLSLMLGFMALTVFAWYSNDAAAAPPIGSQCTSSGDKQICKYPNGTTWECDAQLNSCTRIARTAPSGTKIPTTPVSKQPAPGTTKPAAK